MDILSFLNQELFWGNTVKQIGISALILLVAFSFKRWSSQTSGKIIFRLFKKLSFESYLQEYTKMVAPAFHFLMFAFCIFIVGNVIKFPEALHISGNRSYNIDHLYLQSARTLIIIAFIYYLLRMTDFVGLILHKRAEQTESKADDVLVPFIKDIVKVALFLIGLLMLMSSVFSLNVTAIIGSLGIGGLAVALAAQDTLGNLFGSFTIFADKPFSVGDSIETSGFAGTVEKVGFRSTRIRTADKSYVTIPNKNIVSNPLNNITMSTQRRAKFNIGLLYATPIPVMKKIIDEIRDLLINHEETSNDPLVSFFAFGESSLDIQIIYLVETASYNKYALIREEINYRIMEIVQKHGSDFAFPTRTVHPDTPAAPPPGKPAASPAD
jgi:MscS family membrane protein